MVTPTPRRRSRATPRKPGRPGGQSADQRERLLDAAVAVYAREGMAAASLRSIAIAAQVTPALVGYYFGGKQALADAVIEERVMPAVGEFRSALQNAGDDLCASVAGFIRGAHAAVERHPWLPALWLREIVNEGGALRELLLQRVAPQVPRVLAERFAQAQRRGALNADLDPRLLVVSLVGLTLFPLAAAPIWRQLFDADDIGPAELVAHTFALLDRGLEADHAH